MSVLSHVYAQIQGFLSIGVEHEKLAVLMSYRELRELLEADPNYRYLSHPELEDLKFYGLRVIETVTDMNPPQVVLMH